MQLDHLAITCASLEDGTAWAEERLGVPLEPGGRHDRFGTHNRLISLGPGLYLEVIAPEPGTTPAVPRWFDLNHATAPRLRHPAYRNFFSPERNDIVAGFRSVQA